MAQSVVVLEKDLRLARHIAGGLRSYFSVQIALSREELRENLARNHPEAVILDIENWRLTDVERLHREFPDVPIVCTHRIPDDDIWTAALTAGACDVCPADDVQVVLTSVLRNMAALRTKAVA
jgi:DNA-binding response OmpR family regulator